MKTLNCFKFAILLTITLLGAINAGNMIPDAQNPVQIYFPNVISSTSSLSSNARIDIRFSMDDSSPGLAYNQYIALVFPSNLSDLQFDQGSGAKYSCSLTDGTTTFAMTAEKPLIANEANFAYCRLTDRTNNIVKSGTKVNYKFTLTLTGAKLTANYVRSLKLFTATSNKVSKMIIDQLSFVGNVALYNDASSQASKAIDITSSSILVGSSTETNIYPYQTFDIALNIKSNIFIAANDFVITFRFNKNVVTPAQSAISNALTLGSASDPLTAAIKGSLTISTFSTGDGITLSGITEDLIPNRQFQVVLKSWKALDKLTNTQSPLEMMVYYKNTYSLISFVTASTNFFKISYASITVSAGHPEGYDIFRNGVFPMKFTFSSNKDLTNGGFILIQQSNTQDLISRFNFVAATCDFSDNDNNFDQGFGKRPQCYPIRTDFNYPGTPSTGYPGSGIFFYMKNLQQNKNYYVTVWGSADACGGTTQTISSYQSFNSSNSTSTKFAFQATIYTGINANRLNEARFTNIPVIAQSISTNMTNTCWNNMTQITTSLGSLDATKNSIAAIPFQTGANFYESTNKFASALIDGSATLTVDTVTNLYREFANFSLFQAGPSATGNTYLADVTAAANFPTEFFLYGSNQVSASSFFSLRTNFFTQGGRFFHEFIPSPVLFVTGKSSYRYMSGRLELKAPKTWFTLGDSPLTSPGCYFSWGVSASNTAAKTGSINLQLDTTSSASGSRCPLGSNIPNFITSFTTTTNGLSGGGVDCTNAKVTLDTSNSILPANSSTNTNLHYKILSVFHNGGDSAVTGLGSVKTADVSTGISQFAFPIASVSAANNINIALAADTFNSDFVLFSSCLKWNPPSSIKSLYTAIDIQLNWLYSTTSSDLSGPPVRAMRFIKLFPEGGVFQDTVGTAKKINTGSGNAFSQEAVDKRSYKLHYATGLNNVNVGVCLIEIWGKGLQDVSDSASPVLAIWIGFGVILEQDYNDLSSNYPAAPLANPSYNAYGLQSGNFMNAKENFTNYQYLQANDRFVPEIAKLNDGAAADTGNANQLRNLLIQFTGTGHTTNPTFETTIWTGNTASTFSSIDESSAFVWSATSTKNYARSHYLFLMGSLLLITGITSNSITTTSNNVANNLLIPIYCPIHDTTSNAIQHMNGLPTLYMAYLTMSAFNSISSVNRIYTHQYTNAKTTLFYTVISPANYYATATPYYRNSFTNAGLSSDSNNYFNYLFTLRWAPYTSTITNNDNVLYLYYNNTNTAPSSLTSPYPNCTGHVLLVNSSFVTIDSNNLTKSGLVGSDPALFNGNKKFYYLGFEFNKAILIGLTNGSTNATPNNGATTTSSLGLFSIQPLTSESATYYLTGIKRPAVDLFYTNDTYNSPFSKLAYFCSSAQAQTPEMWSNYLFYPTALPRSFIVDFNPPVSSPKSFTVTISQDKTETIFKNDIAGNTKIDVTLPNKIPGGFSIKFFASSNAFNSNTICGLITSNTTPVVECTQETSSLFSCPVNRSDNNYKICCYNVSISSDTFSLNNLYVYVPAAPNALLTTNKFNTDTLYTASSQISPSNTLTWSTAQSSGTDVIGTQNARITKIDYQQVIQDTGIGKVSFTATLPREPTRNMAITFVGDFSGMLIQNSPPRCVATFGNTLGSSWDNSGDVLLDTCDISNFSSSTNPIIITTKNVIYKCGLSFSSKTLTVRLWPVIVIDWRNNPYSSNNYKVTMTLNTTSNDAIAYNTPTFNIANTLSYAPKPGFVGQWDTLCAVSSVVPKIPGEYADYTFDFDLDTNKGAISNATPNEASIFFPYTHYGSGIDNVLCFYNNALLNCSFTDEGILNIRFTSVLPVGSGKKITIVITGIYNPSVDTDLYFPCTVNKTDFSSGVRTNIITGSGKLAGGIPIITSTTQGAIRFINTTIVTDINPRNVSTHSFKVTFDSAIGLSSTPITIVNTPQIIVTFPIDYNLAWYNNVKATAVIDEYTNDTTNTVTKTATINPANVTQSGNRVTITLPNVSYTFSTSWRFWEVKLSNITGPTDSTSGSNNSTTGPYSVILTNSNYSSVFRTHNNLNNLAYNTMSVAIDSYIQFNRGVEFKFDNSKWVVDINTSGLFNKLTIRPGRFIASSFTMKTNTSNFIQPRSATISLNDQTFRLADTSYSIATATYQPTLFFIGAPCGTAPGNYLVNFTINGDNIGTFFAPLAPVQISVDASTTGVASFTIPPSIPAGSSTLVYISLSEPNVDSLTISWTPSETNKNDSTATLSSLTIPGASIKAGNSYIQGNQYSSTFKITNPQATNNQIFKPNNLNACYSWAANTITFFISGTQAIIPNDYNFTNSFKYSNAETDSTLTIKNGIKFTFTPPYSPIYVYCALVCFNRNYPSDDIIRASVNNNYNLDNLTRFYTNMFNTKTPSDIIFDNLVRGQRYKLRCIISSTEGDLSLRTSASVNIDQFTTSNGTNSLFIPAVPTKTQCVQYYFTSDPGQATKIAMVNYCQKLFSSSGWSQSGCIICTDSGLSYTSPGLSLPTNLTCTSSAAKSKLRFLQTTSTATTTPTTTSSSANAPGTAANNAVLTPTTAGSTVNPSYVNQSNPITYSICPVQHPVCQTDVSGNKLYADYFNQLIADTRTSALFNTNLGIVNVPVNSTLIVSDVVAPDVSRNFVVSILSLNANGLVQFSATYPSALRCSWQIAETSAAPTTGAQIDSCVDTQWCGKKFNVGTLVANTSTDVTNLKAFTSGKTYGLYIACYNDVPFSTSISNISSTPLSIPNQPTTSITPPSGPTNTTTNTGSEFSYFSYAILMIFALLI